MKKIIFVLLLFVSILGLSNVYVPRKSIIEYPVNNITIYADEEFNVRIYYSSIDRNIIINNDKSNFTLTKDFSLKKVRDGEFKLIFPDKPGAYKLIIETKENYYSRVFFYTHFKGFIASDENNLYFGVYDLKRGKFLNEIFYFSGSSKKKLNGPLFRFSLNTYEDKLFFVDNNIVVISKYSSWNQYPKIKALVIMDKPLYAPGDTIRFRVNLFKREGNKYVPYVSKAQVILEDPFRNIILNKEFLSDEYGGFSLEYKTTKEIVTGNYYIRVVNNGKTISWYYFLIQDYVKPTYKLEISTDATQIIAGNTVKIITIAKYLNGDPVKNAEVLFYTYKDGYLINKTFERTNEKGIAEYTVLLNEPGYHRIQVLISDDSGKQYDKNTYVKVLQEDINISGNFEGNKLKLHITNLQGNPLKGIATVTFKDKREFVTILNGTGEVTIPEDIYMVTVKFGSVTENFFKGYKQDIVFKVDRKTVKPGDNIKLTFTAKDAGILCIGGSKIQQIFLVNKPSDYSIYIPDNEISKNYFIEFLGLENRQLQKLSILHSRVKIKKITTDKEIYVPGETVSVQLENSKNLKVVSVVDEGLFELARSRSLIEYLYPDNRYPGFYVYNSGNYIYFDALSQFEKNKKSHVFTTTKETQEKRIRDYFPQVAYWNPNLFASKFSFKAPDSITKWRINVFEISKEYVSYSTKTFVVSKPFEIKLFLPEFLIVGDEVDGTIYIKNYTGEKGNVFVSLQASGANVNFSEKSFSVDSDLRIPITLKAENTDNIEIIAKAEMNNYFDGIKITIPVHNINIVRKTGKIIKVSGEKRFPKNSNIKIINDIRALLEPSIKELIKYPYGCTEQTMSSFYPALVAKSFIEVDNLDDIILKGLQRLLKFQHYDGGWGWWPNDESDVFMTAYVLEGLYYAKKNGYFYPKEAVNAAIQFLKNSEINGYSAFVLKLYGENIAFSGKDVYDFVYTSPSKIKKLAIQKEDYAYIKGEGFYSSVHLTSAAIRTLTMHKQNLELRDKLITYLIRKKKGPFWYSTKDTALSILAIIESGNLKSELTTIETENSIIVKGNGYVEITETETITPDNKSNNNLNIKSTDYKRHMVKFKNTYLDAFLPLSSEYIPLTMTLVSTPSTFTEIPEFILETVSRGTPVYFENNALVIIGPFKFSGNEETFKKGAYKITYKKIKPSLKKGDFIKTEITLEGTSNEYLIIEEFLPSCAEVIKYYVENTSEDNSKFSYSWYYNKKLWYSYVDYKKDKISFFIRSYDGNKRSISYYWRLMYSGKFKKKPTFIYNMYFEDTISIGDFNTYTIKK
ncbi:alpha-2-macroglobulin [Thermosipho ferrireducens]|uniref:Alpha-2-macroglobulin n=1 Tax=Thermosipho ferrireducens TaxID=2571116 RepID=A0ABX7S4Y8_9BACT|nr:MG2 domain-containing protein [Thermosipho ferrireducens]QTA37542.1 alpha-2-macroglobulin [Thermosipho ferrireducens]